MSSHLMPALLRFGMLSIAMALPWELYQRIPFTNMTWVKLAGALLIAGAAFDALRRGLWRPPKTGLEWPIAVFAAVCLVSIAYSVDRGTSIAHARMYATYLLFFYAAAYLVQSVGNAKTLWTAYIVSTAGAATATLLCAGGVLWPTLWGTASWPAQQLLEEYRDGLAMRMTASGTDFNLTAMLLLTAFAASLFLFDPQGGRLRRMAIHSLQVLFVAAIAVTMSRTALIFAAGFFALYVYRSWGKGIRLAYLLVPAVAVVAAVLVLRPDFFEILLDRARGGVFRDDGSARGRAQVYAIGLRLLPEYVWTGCGLGAIDAAFAKSPYEAQAVMTLHSVPFKMLLELGVAGFAAYVWLCGTALWRVYSRLARSADGAVQRLGWANLTGMAAILFMTLVQPFPVLSFYPFILALALGPIAARGTKAQESAAGRPVRESACAVAAVGLLVACNGGLHQHTTTMLAAYSDRLRPGIDAESRVAWDEAASAYGEAWALADHAVFRDRAFFEEAAQVVDLPRLFQDLKSPVNTPDPAAAAAYARGRACLALVQIGDAATAYDAARQRDGRFGFLAFDLAEAHWTVGRYADARAAYAAAAQAADAPALHHTRIEALRRRAQALEGRSDEPARLERAAALRRLGRWDEAVMLYRETASSHPQSAEAAFQLGAAAEADGQPSHATAQYRTALELAPNHWDARRGLQRLGTETTDRP